MIDINKYPNARLVVNMPGYAVTSCGKVLSLSREILLTYKATKKVVATRVKLKEMKPTKGSGGHPRISARINGKSKTVYVKNLVAAAFLKPISGKNIIVWHNDENVENNAADNLSYITFKQLCLLTNNYDYRNTFKKN